MNLCLRLSYRMQPLIVSLLRSWRLWMGYSILAQGANWHKRNIERNHATSKGSFHVTTKRHRALRIRSKTSDFFLKSRLN